MSEPETGPVARSARQRKMRDIAWLLPLLGIFLFLTPLPYIFTGPQTAFGMPLIFVFLYGVWAALIIASRAVARRIGETQE